jgi:hypothetical protein
VSSDGRRNTCVKFIRGSLGSQRSEITETISTLLKLPARLCESRYPIVRLMFDGNTRRSRRKILKSRLGGHHPTTGWRRGNFQFVLVFRRALEHPPLSPLVLNDCRLVRMNCVHTKTCRESECKSQLPMKSMSSARGEHSFPKFTPRAAQTPGHTRSRKLARRDSTTAVTAFTNPQRHKFFRCGGSRRSIDARTPALRTEAP